MTMIQSKIFQSQALDKEKPIRKPKETSGASMPKKVPEKTDVSSAKELMKLPAPDPVRTSFRSPLSRSNWMRDVTLRALADLGKSIRKDKLMGTPLLRLWESESHFPFIGAAGGDQFNYWIPNEILGDEKDQTWEEGASAVFANCNNDIDEFHSHMEEAWDVSHLKEKEDDQDLYALAVRRFTHALAHQDPGCFFDINQKEWATSEGDDAVVQNTFWNFETWYNPSLKLEMTPPLPEMWLRAATYLGHPWVWSDEMVNVFSKANELLQKREEVNRSKLEKRRELKRSIQDKRKRSRNKENTSDDEDDEEEKRSSAPYQPSSPDKSGSRFRSTTRGEMDKDGDTEMMENGDISDGMDNGKNGNAESPATTYESAPPTADESSDEESEDEESDDTRKSVSQDRTSKPSKTLRFEDDGNKSKKSCAKSPEINSFFAPKSSKKVSPGQSRILKLSPKGPPKPPSGRRKGVEAKNETSDQIEEESASEKSVDSSVEVTNVIKPTPDQQEQDDLTSDEEWVDPGADEEDEEDDVEFFDSEQEDTNINSPPGLVRRRTLEDDSTDDESDDEEQPDPLDGVETTNGVYRNTGLGIFDAMAAAEIEKERQRNEVQAIQSRTTRNSNKSGDAMDVDNDDGRNGDGDKAKNQNELYSKVASRPVQTKILSEEQKVQKLIQPKLDGIPVHNWYIPIFALSFMWNGAAAGTSITKVAISALHSVWEALFKTSHKFKILPLDDAKCKNQKLWITNPERMKQLCSHWYQVKNYLDMDFGNVEWLTSQAKTPGNKLLKTRIRFAFDDTVEGAMATLSGILEEDGGFVKECPLQMDHIGFSGSLPFLPPMMSPDMLAHALMKEMGFMYAIALIWDWVSSPSIGLRGGANKGKRNPSVQMWRVLTAIKHMPQVGEFLRKLYNPKTPRHLLPWCGISTYFHDWRAASKKWLSVGAHGPVREMAISLIQKAIDFESVTKTFCSPIPIPGMLRVVKTTKFGEISLLRFLYSIKATPHQIETAEDGKETNGETVSTATAKGESTEQTDPETEEFIEILSKKTKKATKDELLRLAAEQAMLPERSEREQRAELVRKKDAEKYDPLKLFSAIVPESPFGYFALTCRVKVVPLAGNVIEGLTAFIIAHLDEPNPKRAEKIAAKWLGKEEVARMKRMGEQWNKETLRMEIVSSEVNKEVADECGMDWLEFGNDITDQVQGFLEIDISSADTKDIDDGATVTGAADDMRAKDTMIQNMVMEISIRDEENDLLKQRVAELEAEKAARDAQVPSGQTQSLSSKQTPSSSKQPSQSKKGAATSVSGAKVSMPKNPRSKPSKAESESSESSRSRSRRGGGTSAKGPC